MIGYTNIVHPDVVAPKDIAELAPACVWIKLVSIVPTRRVIPNRDIVAKEDVNAPAAVCVDKIILNKRLEP